MKPIIRQVMLFLLLVVSLITLDECSPGTVAAQFKSEVASECCQPLEGTLFTFDYVTSELDPITTVGYNDAVLADLPTNKMETPLQITISSGGIKASAEFCALIVDDRYDLAVCGQTDDPVSDEDEITERCESEVDSFLDDQQTSITSGCDFHGWRSVFNNVEDLSWNFQSQTPT